MRIAEESEMSLFGYSVGEVFVVLEVNNQGELNIDSSHPCEFWKPWRFEKL